MYIDMANNFEVPEYLTFNAYGSYRIKNIEVGARVNNIFNRINYYNAAEGATALLWFRDAGTSVFGDVKFYF
jgi:outer membrane receptor protein involved in Fe transport